MLTTVDDMYTFSYSLLPKLSLRSLSGFCHLMTDYTTVELRQVLDLQRPPPFSYIKELQDGAGANDLDWELCSGKC